MLRIKKSRFFLKPGGPCTNLGTFSLVRLFVIGGFTYSNSSSSNSKGSAAEPTPHTQGLPSKHLQRCSTIKSTLTSKITLSAQTSSSSLESQTPSSLLVSSS